MNQQSYHDLIVQNAILLEGVKAHLSDEMRESLLALRIELKQFLDLDDELAELSKRDIDKVLEELDALLLAGFAAATRNFKNSLVELSVILADFEQLALASLGIEANQAPQKLIDALLKSRPLSVTGINTEPLLEPFINGFSNLQKVRIEAIIKQGIAQGLTNTEIRQRIIGTKKNGYADGLVGASIRSGDAMVRTAVQHVSSMVRQATAEENADIVEGIQLLATLDSRTSHICRSLDQKIFPLDKGPRPPLHINCRTTCMPYLKEKYQGVYTVDSGRASKDGVVSANLTYYEWLKTQSASFQDEVLGVQRGKLFRDGGLSAEKFAELQLDKQFKPRTLDELRALVPKAFERAGI